MKGYLEGKLASSACTRKEERSKIHNQSFHFRKLENENQIKSKAK